MGDRDLVPGQASNHFFSAENRALGNIDAEALWRLGLVARYATFSDTAQLVGGHLADVAAGIDGVHKVGGEDVLKGPRLISRSVASGGSASKRT